MKKTEMNRTRTEAKKDNVRNRGSNERMGKGTREGGTGET